VFAEGVIVKFLDTGSRDGFPESVDILGTLPARIEFLVCLPLSGKLALPLKELEECAFWFPLELTLGGIFI
jgi:hypothetical protein